MLPPRQPPHLQPGECFMAQFFKESLEQFCRHASLDDALGYHVHSALHSALHKLLLRELVYDSTTFHFLKLLNRLDSCLMKATEPPKPSEPFYLLDLGKAICLFRSAGALSLTLLFS